MVPAAARLTSGESLRRCVRAGRRSASRTLVVHLDRAPGSDDRSARVGFVVSRAVGGAVVRNRVRRRLRHLVRDRLPDLPTTSVLVVRALPAAATATHAELRADLARCLDKVLPTQPTSPVSPVMQP